MSSVKRLEKRVAAKQQQLAAELQNYSYATFYSAEQGAVNYPVSLVYIVAGSLTVAITFISTVFYNLDWGVNIYNLKSASTAASMQLISQVGTYSVGAAALLTAAYLLYTGRYAYDKFTLLLLPPLIYNFGYHLCMYNGILRVVESDAYGRLYSPHMLVEWFGTGALIMLAISHLPSTKPAEPYKSSDDSSTFSFWDSNKPKITTKKQPLNSPSKKVSVAEERRRLEEEKSNKKAEANGDNGTPVYSLIQCHMLMLVFTALAHFIPSDSQYNIYMLIGALITGTAYTVCIYTFVLQKYIPNTRATIARQWFLFIQLYYPIIWFIAHVLSRFVSVTSAQEYSMYLLGDWLGKVLIVAVLHDVMTNSRRSSTKGATDKTR